MIYCAVETKLHQCWFKKTERRGLFKRYHGEREIRYGTIRDASLTCARKPT